MSSIAATPSAEPTGLRAIARRRPIALYLAFVFGLGYPLMLLPVLAGRGVIPGASLPALVGLDLERASAFLLVVFALFPAAIIVSGLEGGKPAVMALLRRLAQWRIGLGWWAVVILALPATTVAISLVMGDTLKPLTLGMIGEEIGGALAGYLLVNLWEETAWAGFMQTRLERRYNLYAAAAITAVPFAAIHLPLQLFQPNPTITGVLIQFVLLSVLGIVVRSFLGLVMRGAGNSLLAVGLAHTMFNRSNNTDGIAAKLLEGNHRQLGALLATLVLAIVLGLLARGKSGTAERARLDALNGEPIRPT